MLARSWRCRTRTIDLTDPVIMGIVNVTPDSFSDGGLYATHDAAVERALKLARDGALIIDVGGESTRPGAADVTAAEELERVVPVVETLAREGLVVSVDTSKPEVMRAAVAAGAEILNDIRAFTEAGASEAAADTRAGLVVMHMQGTPKTMQTAPSYTDVVREVEEFLLRREAALIAAGVDRERICWDPGFGFGKTHAHNFALLAATERFAQSGRPYLMALSRKSSLGAVCDEPVAAKRVAASLAGALIAVDRGARIVRVHDAAETRQALSVWRAVKAAE